MPSDNEPRQPQRPAEDHDCVRPGRATRRLQGAGAGARSTSIRSTARSLITSWATMPRYGVMATPRPAPPRPDCADSITCWLVTRRPSLETKKPVPAPISRPVMSRTLSLRTEVLASPGQVFQILSGRGRRDNEQRKGGKTFGSSSSAASFLDHGPGAQWPAAMVKAAMMRQDPSDDPYRALSLGLAGVAARSSRRRL